MNLSAIRNCGIPRTFKDFSKTLARQDELKIKKKKKKEVSSFASLKVINDQNHYHLQFNEPLSFKNVLKKSPILSQIENEDTNQVIKVVAEETVDKNLEIDWNKVMSVVNAVEKQCPTQLENVEELMTKPGIRPTCNLASVVNEATALQKLVDIGTKIAKWEEQGFVDLALSLDFQKDVIPRIYFLVDNGIHPDDLGLIFTQNPELFKMDLEDLQVRINYLKHHGFTKDEIKDVIKISESKWLNFPVVDIDSRLGIMGKMFKLKKIQVRKVASTCPQLILWTGTPNQLENNYLAITDLMGFEMKEVQNLVLKNPALFMAKDTDDIQDCFDVLHMDVGYSHELLTHFPQALSGDKIIIKARQKLLQKLKKDQFDPNLANYVNPEALALYSDEKFCAKIAKIPLSLYNKFMLTV